MHLLIGLAGIVLILAIAFALSSNRRAIRPRVVGAAFLLQAGILLKAEDGDFVDGDTGHTGRIVHEAGKPALDL